MSELPQKIPTHRVNVPASPKHKRRVLATCSRKWRRIRARVLARHPECTECGRLASVVDHIDNDSTNNREENLRPMCRSCHAKKTARHDGSFGRPTDTLPTPAPARQDAPEDAGDAIEPEREIDALARYRVL